MTFRSLSGDAALAASPDLFRPCHLTAGKTSTIYQPLNKLLRHKRTPAAASERNRSGHFPLVNPSWLNIAQVLGCKASPCACE